MTRKIQLVTLLPLLVGFIFASTSCISEKKIIYLQGADTLYAVPQQIQQAFELKIQPDDELAISVDSKKPESIHIFNNKTLIGSGNTTSTSTTISAGLAYFVVDENGDIEFPIFGKINTSGKTCRQLANELQTMLRTGQEKVADAIVTVKVMSFKVTVLGDVSQPGTKTFQGERLTLLEALGLAGDLNATAQRDKILIVREIGDTRVTYEVDLRNPQEVFNSPAYYMQQNDIVYVRPNKSVRLKGSTGYALLSVASTILGMVISMVSLVIAIKR